MTFDVKHTQSWPIVSFGVDPGATSGYAIFERELPLKAGVAITATDRSNAVRAALRSSEASRLPLVVSMEKWPAGGRFGGSRTMSGLGSAAGRWLEAMEAAGIKKSRVQRVYPQTWFSRTVGGRMSRDKTRQMTMFNARFPELGQLHADAADAVGIALWALHADETRKAIPKRDLKRLEKEALT